MLGLQTQANSVSLQEHPEFLSLLQDEKFRQELQAKPAAVLASLGVSLDASDVPASVELPEAPVDYQAFYAGLM